MTGVSLSSESSKTASAGNKQTLSKPLNIAVNECFALPECVPREARQADLEFKVSLIYLLNSRTRQIYITENSPSVP